MSRLLDAEWQLGAFAFESDFIDSSQFSAALSAWAEQSNSSLLDILIEQHCLTNEDILLLDSLWQRHHDRRASIDFEAASQVDDSTIGSDRQEGVESRARFQVENEIAEGGLGRVFLAREELTNRRVALKEMLPRLANDVRSRQRFAREAEITASLDHPAIVPIYHFGLDQKGVPFYCMRWIEGQTLKQAADELHSRSGSQLVRQLEFRRALQSVLTVCQAIAHAHARGVVHRDIKPANILIGEHGETVLVDWGLAKRLDEADGPPAAEELKGQGDAESITIDGSAIGTPAYMSPEVALGEPASPASDIFSLGATLAYLLIGHAPYRGQTVAETFKLAQAHALELPGQLADTQARPLLAICRKCLAHKVEDRYTDASQLAEELERYLADESVSVWSADLTTRARRWLRRYPSQATAAAVLTLAAIVGTVAFSVLTRSANKKLIASSEREHQARRQADADNKLALRSLQRVTNDIQQKLKNVPATQKIRRQMLETAISGLNELSANIATRETADRDAMKAHRDLGEMYMDVGNIGTTNGVEEAKREFQHALTIARSLVKSPAHTDEDRRQLAICLNFLGRSELQSGSTSEALQHQQEALEVLMQIEREGGHNPDAQRTLAVTHNLIGDIEISGGSLEQAGAHYQAALKIREAAMEAKQPLPDAERDLLVALNKVGEYHLRVGKPEEAGEYFQRALELSERQVEKQPDDFNAQRDLSVAYYKIAKQFEALGQLDQALPYYRKSLAADEAKLALDTNNAQAQRDCIEANFFMAEALRSLMLDDDAIQVVERSLSLGERLLAVDPSQRSAARTLAYAYTTRGDILIASDPKRALSDYQRCVALMKQLAEQDPSNPRAGTDIAFGLSGVGDCLLAMDQVDDALSSYQEALELQKERASRNPSDVKVQINLAQFAMRVGKALSKTGRTDQARDFLTESLRVAEQVAVQASGEINAQVLLVTTLSALGDFESAGGNQSSARKHYERALSLAEELHKQGKLNGKDSKWIDDLTEKLSAT